MNETCYDHVLDLVSRGEQCLVFVHSRKETVKTARYLRDRAVGSEGAESDLSKFISPTSATREILLSESSSSTLSSPALKDLLPFGIAVHHAGLNAGDRGTVEALFREGHVRVLVCTATLAWGVNLPAHGVVIKGTQVSFHFSSVLNG